MAIQQIPQAQPTPEQTLAQQIGKVAGVLSSNGFPAGERAALRRMSPGSFSVPFCRFATRHLPSGWERAVDDWMTIVAGIALMSPHAHNPRIRFGKALRDAGYSELRLERLLVAQGEARRTLFLRAIRALAAKCRPFNWLDGALFLLLQDENKREKLNLAIARAYYDETNGE